MTTRDVLLVVVAGLPILAGCAGTEIGSERSLGAVTYAQAFDAARAVMGQYYSVASADPETGVIRSVPKPLAAGVLSGGPGRQVATVRVRPTDGTVVASATVTIQRQTSAAARQMGWPAGVYDGPPNQTPAELEAATTADQNESWISQRRDRGLEEQLLADIHKALYPQAGGE